MTQSAVDTHARHDHAAIARWDDEGGASTFRPRISDQRSAMLASWLVPPVVVPIFFTALIIVSGIYQQFQ